MSEIGQLAEPNAELDLQKLEQCSKAFCFQLKAIQDLEAHNSRQTQRETEQTYSRYEDLPPLRPEDHDRLKQDLINLLSPKDTD